MMENQDTEQRTVLSSDARQALYETIPQVFTKYIADNSGIDNFVKSMFAHKLRAARMMQEIFTYFKQQSDNANTLEKNFYDACMVLMILRFLEYSKLAAAAGADESIGKKADRVLSLQKKTKINTKGKLVPALLDAVEQFLKNQGISVQRAETAGESLHARIKLICDQIGTIYQQLPAVILTEEVVRYKVIFAMRLVAYLMQQGDQTLMDNGICKHAEELIRLSLCLDGSFLIVSSTAEHHKTIEGKILAWRNAHTTERSSMQDIYFQLLGDYRTRLFESAQVNQGEQRRAWANPSRQTPLQRTDAAITRALQHHVLVDEYQDLYRAAYQQWWLMKYDSNNHRVLIQVVSDLVNNVRQFAPKGLLNQVIKQFIPNYLDWATDYMHANGLLTDVINHESIRPQIPHAWSNCGSLNFVVNSTAYWLTKFPRTAVNLKKTDNEGNTSGFNANHDDYVLSSCGPNTAHMGGGTLAEFAELVLTERPWCILALGPAKDYKDYWVQDFNDGNVILEVLPKAEQGHQLQFTHRRTNKTHTVFMVHADVEDNTPVQLSYATAKMVVRMANYSSDNNPILIHCASGVGRTGQMKWLMALVRRLNKNEAFAALVDNALAATLTKGDVTQLVADMIGLLFQFRQTRYTLQSNSQLYSIVPALLQLRIVQLGQSETYFNSVTEQLFGAGYQPTNFPVKLLPTATLKGENAESAAVLAGKLNSPVLASPPERLQEEGASTAVLGVKN